jgi:hypothetical protein
MFARTFALPATSWMPRPTLRNLVSGYTHLWGAPAGILLALLTLAGAVAVQRRGRFVPASVLRHVTIAAAVIVGAFVISQVRPLYLSPRTPVFVLPAAAFAIAWLVSAVPVRGSVTLVAVVVCAVSLRASIGSARAPDPMPTRASLAFVASRARCGDLVVAAGVSYAAVDYYARPSGLPACVAVVPFPAEMARHPGWPDMRRGFVERLRAEAPAAAATFAPGARVWLLRSSGGLGLEAGEAISTELRKARPVLGEWPLTGSFFEQALLFGPAS